jgi:hypothetical protein
VRRGPEGGAGRLWVRALLATVFVLAGTARADEADVLASLRAGHPRLLLNEAQLAAAVEAARTDPLRAALHRRLIAAAEAMLPAKPIEHVLIGPRLLDKSRTCLCRVMTCALAFRLTGDGRFAERAGREMRAAAAFKDWNPSHFLDVAEMSFALALGYDWLYPQLGPDDRAAVRRALLDKALVFAPAAYHRGGPADPRLWFAAAHHNWNQVCNGGLLAAALALADEEPGVARLVVDGAVRSLPLAMDAYQPDGAYPEGPAYWGYGTGYNVVAIALLEGALGSDFGLAEAPAFDRTALYRLHAQGPSGLFFNYADGAPREGNGPDAAYTWLAARFHLAQARAQSRALLASALAADGSPDDPLFALNAVWFPERAEGDAPAAPLDVHFRGGADLAIFRSAWNDPRALYLGFKAGRNDVNHAHLDLGSFVLDADGVRWAEDLGYDEYNLPGYFGDRRWSYYRLNNRSHNTLTPADRLQEVKAQAPIVAFGSAPARAFAVADLTAAYPGAARRMLRGVALLDRSRVLVQDDIDGVAPGTPLVWRMMTGARVARDGGRGALLERDGRSLRVDLLAPPEAQWTTGEARPPTAAEDPNRGVTELRIDVPAGPPDLRIAVLLSPIGEPWPAVRPAPPLTPVAEWR